MKRKLKGFVFVNQDDEQDLHVVRAKTKKEAVARFNRAMIAQGLELFHLEVYMCLEATLVV